MKLRNGFANDPDVPGMLLSCIFIGQIYYGGKYRHRHTNHHY